MLMEVKDFGVFFNTYKNFAQSENKSPRTIEATTQTVRKFLDFLGGCDDVRQVTSEDLRRYIRHLQSRPRWSDHPTVKRRNGTLSPHSVAHHVRHIRAFWSWLKLEGFTENNPFESVKPPKAPRKIVKTLSVEQVTHLISVIPRDTHIGFRDRTIILALYGTGLRVSELLDLKLEDVNFETGQIKVLGKGSRERVVFMSASVYKSLFKYLHRWRPAAPSSYFFLGNSGRPPTRSNIAHKMQGYGRKAGITDARCTPHTFRHSFAVQFLRNGGGEFTLQHILGHSTLTMTRQYVELANDDIEVKLKMYSPAELVKTG
jgi:site-specific recombinase XerD